MMIKKNVSGVSLLEVLITVLLTAVGILGMVAMQGKSIQYTQDTTERTYAAMLANEYLEIIRATPSSILDDATDSPLFNSLPASTPSDRCQDIDNELIATQVSCWASRARLLLPGADSLGSEFTSCISTEPGVCDSNGAAVEIRLAWHATGEGCLTKNDVEDSLCTFTFRSQI